jgi:hypothetical protein
MGLFQMSSRQIILDTVVEDSANLAAPKRAMNTYGTNLFLTTTNDATCETFWGPDDKWEIRFSAPKQ